jgi:TRAP-type transport system periplasmic protein
MIMPAQVIGLWLCGPASVGVGKRPRDVLASAAVRISRRNFASMLGQLSRRSVLAGSLAASLAFAGCGVAKTGAYNLRLTTSFPGFHPLNKWCALAIDKIGERSNGSVTIQMFVASQLGSDTERLAQLRGGAIDLNVTSGGIVSMLVPVASVNNIGFAFTSLPQAFAAMDGELGRLVRAEISAAGLFAFPRIFDNGFRQITSSTRIIRDPADLADMKIRVPLGRLWTSMFSALGALPTAINFSETYSALQTRVVEGQENSLLVVEAAKLFEVQRYCSLTNHMWDGIWLLANPESMNRLPEPIQCMILEEFSKAAIEQRRESAEQDIAVRSRLRHLPISVNAVDPKPFVAMLRATGFYAEWRDRLGARAWTTLESYTGKLA